MSREFVLCLSEPLEPTELQPIQPGTSCLSCISPKLCTFVNLKALKIVTSELVVDVQPKEVSIALLEDKQLVELQSEGRTYPSPWATCIWDASKKLMPGLNACFVDVGYEKDAFLHYQDLGPQFRSLEKYVKQTLSDRKKLNPITKATLLPDLEKEGTIANTLKVGQEVVVQIVKEPISTKGPRLTSELSFAGRYLVLIPFNDKVSVSQKIKSSEEARPPQAAADEHQAQELRCHRAHRGRRQARSRTRRRA